MPNPVLQVQSVSKRFPGVVALDDVSVELFNGEVLSVIGENGAGKSTLMKILAGIQIPDAGTIRRDGKDVVIDSVEMATHLGIALIHQELNLCQNLSVAANVFLGREPARMGCLSNAAMEKAADVFLKQVGLDVHPSTLAGDLSIGQQQLVEIAKALSINAKIVIMDEPTSSLTQRETEFLYEIIDSLRAAGISIIYISHRLTEVIRLSDRVVVLRDGKHVGELQKSDIDRQNMIRLMVGRSLEDFYQKRDYQRGKTALSVNGLRTHAFPNNPVSFEIGAGEIVGIAGLVGSGRTEILTSIFGVTSPLAGVVELDGAVLKCNDCQSMIGHGVALVPEDRKQQGVVLQMAIQSNISLSVLQRLSAAWLFPSTTAETQLAVKMKDRLRIKSAKLSNSVSNLSGGNQQKVVLAKWLALKPKVLLMDEPTRGVDVGAREEIYELMNEIAQEGVSILFVSSEMEEIIGVSDRIMVMHEGSLAGELAKKDFSETRIMSLATGQAAAV